MNSNTKTSNEQAALDLLNNAQKAAIAVRKERFLSISEYGTQLWKCFRAWRVQKKCRKNNHYVTDWSLWIKQQNVYSEKSWQQENAIPSYIQNVYIGSCQYCGKPHVTLITSHGAQKQG